MSFILIQALSILWFNRFIKREQLILSKWVFPLQNYIINLEEWFLHEWFCWIHFSRIRFHSIKIQLLYSPIVSIVMSEKGPLLQFLLFYWMNCNFSIHCNKRNLESKFLKIFNFITPGLILIGQLQLKYKNKISKSKRQ